MGLLKEHMDAARKERELARRALQPVVPDHEGYVVHVVGKYSDPNFQQVKAAVEHLSATTSYVQCVVEPYFETQFELRLKQLVVQYGDAMKQAKALHPLIYAETHTKKILYFKTPESFFEWAHKRFRYEDTVNFLFYKRRANKAQLGRMIESGRRYATLGLSIAGAPTEYVSLELFSDALPVTVRKFVALLRHRPFLGSIVHRVVPGGWVQMGDWETGSGGHSTDVEDGLPLLDEAFVYKHDRPGLLTLANAGPDRAGSQFCITLKDIAPFDGKYVVFGRVISGLRVIHRIGRAKLENERPVEPVRITEVQPDLLSDENPLVAEARQEVEAKKAEMDVDLADPELNKAATKIQSIQRQKEARKKVQDKRHQKEESRAATKVQGLYRQKAARQRVAGVREQKNAENAAATKVQATYRGKAGRERVKEIKTRTAVTHSVDDLA
jgi:cyclophilin family peptidyl-prolyl cis-trans isomerase